MRKSNNSSKIFTRRALFIGALQVGALVVLGGRLAWLQIAQGPLYKTLSDKNRINLKMLAPSRGRIVDRFGVPLAVNEQNFRVLLIPEQADNIKKSLRSLQNLIEINQRDIEEVLERASRVAKFVSVEVRDNLSWEDVAKIEVNLPDLPGLSIDVGERRSYPYREATAHIVGYVGAVNKSELAGGDSVLSLPGFKIGKTGIERRYDTAMRGSAGASKVEVNVSGREIRELGRKDSHSGKEVMLTIDAQLQRAVQRIISKEKSSSAVLMDVHSGAVYALASYPAFDPNNFTHGLSASRWEELLADPGHPLTNKAIAGQYPPASTFKMVTALAGLKAGKITRSRRVICSGVYEYGNDRFHCWKSYGHGSVNLEEALAQSCDTYFYELATEIGIERIAETARALGMGQKLGFDLAEERPGLVPDKNWKMGHFGQAWRAGETVVAGIGQGYLLSTPLQLAVMVSRLVNGGYAVKPWMTAYVGDEPGGKKPWPAMGINDWHLTLIRKGMEKVVNHSKGTAYGSRIIKPGWEMAGKTGTAQVRKITAQQRRDGVKNQDLSWSQRHHALFAGYAPLRNPRYACAVVVEHGVGGSRAAAPLAKEILMEAQRRDPAKSILSTRSGQDL